MTALATSVTVGGVTYPAGTDHTGIPAAVVDRIRNTVAWVGGTPPALSAPSVGKARLTAADLTSAAKARAALGVNVVGAGGHLVAAGTAPTAAAQAGAGASATATIAGKDGAGQLTVVAGASGTAAGAQAVVTFNVPYAAAPVVTVSPTTAAGITAGIYVSAATTTSFTVAFANAPTASATYVINYHVIGK